VNAGGAGRMSGMCCERLVCANCARPVVEAACSVCRTARAEVHRAELPGGATTLNLALVAVLVTALLAAAAVLYGHFAR